MPSIHHLYCCLLLLSTLLLSGCYDPIDDNTESEGEGGTSANVTEGTLTIRIKATTEITDLVSLFVFDNEGNLKGSRTLAPSADVQAAFVLPLGQYRVAAFMGTAGFISPTVIDAGALFTLPAANYSATPLYMSQADVTITSGRHTLGLLLTPLTAKVEIRLQDVPQNTQAITMSLGRQYTSLSLQGELQKPANAEFIFMPQPDGSWLNDNDCYLLPGASTTTVMTLNLHLPDSTLSYGQTLNYPLQAGGTYSFAGECGAVTSTTDTPQEGNEPVHWGDNNTADWTDSLTTIMVPALPQACSVANGHVVAAIQSSDENSCIAMLVSLNEWENIPSALSTTASNDATTITANNQEFGCTQWRIPTREDATLLKQLYAGANIATINNILELADGIPLSTLDSKDKAVRYLCNEAQHTFSFALGSNSITQAGAKTLYRLRLVKWVRFAIQY